MPQRAVLRFGCSVTAICFGQLISGVKLRVTDGDVDDVAFVHVPYNFGHTVERVAMFGTGADFNTVVNYAFGNGAKIDGSFDPEAKDQMWQQADKLMLPDGKLWGHYNPDLQDRSSTTGCSLFLTPGKYWPKELANHYFGNRTIFGMLRDPYERLIAMFRGNTKGYGAGSDNERFKATCDVNGAVQAMCQKALSSDPFVDQCTFLPQADFFDQPYGITVPLDNRRFPDSVNEFFEAHGLPAFMHVQTSDMFHVSGCNDVWAANLTAETRALVRKAYKRDFELLCKHFGYCDEEEDACIPGVPEMCPLAVVDRMAAKYHIRRAENVGGFAVG